VELAFFFLIGLFISVSGGGLLLGFCAGFLRRWGIIIIIISSSWMQAHYSGRFVWFSLFVLETGKKIKLN
jgi:hypothetical protein